MAPRVLRRVGICLAGLALAAGSAPALAAGTPALGTGGAGTVTAGMPAGQEPPGAPAGVSAPGWRLFKTVTIRGQQPFFEAVSATNAGNAWAVGSAQGGPLAERWSGGAWRTASLPRTALSALGGLTTVGGGATNMWAFDSKARWLHWNGQHWAVGTLPSVTGAGTPVTIKSVTVFSRTDAWVFGEDSNIRPYTAHFDGSTWKVVRERGGGGGMSGSAVSPTDIWGLIDNRGNSGPQVFIVRWNGKSWRDAPGPDNAPFLSAFSSIYAHNNTDVWLGGTAPGGAGLAAHWTGTSWHVTELPHAAGSAAEDLTALTPDGSGGLWALASCGCGRAWRLWHEAGGKWSGPVQPPISPGSQTAGGIAWVPRTASVWGAGTLINGSSTQGTILLDGKVP